MTSVPNFFPKKVKIKKLGELSPKFFFKTKIKIENLLAAVKKKASLYMKITSRL